MKTKLFASLAIILLMAGCITTNVPIRGPDSQPQEIRLTVNGADLDKDKSDDIIHKSMQIPYDEPQFPLQATQIGDTVYYKLWGGIGYIDALSMWETLQVAKYRKLTKLWVYINSPGGSAEHGMAIADILLRAQRDGMEVTTEASGVVASAAVPVLAVGEKGRRMAGTGTLFMIHRGKLFKMFAEEGIEDIRSQGEWMKISEARYNGILADHSNLSIEDIENKCARITYFTAQEAKDWGIIDEIR